MAGEVDLRLTASQLSDRWGGRPSVGTLRQWRYLGKGPDYIRAGRSVLYPLSSVLAFERANTITCSGAA